MKLFKFNYYTPGKPLKEITIISKYESDALSVILKSRIEKEKSTISLKKQKDIYDI